MVCPKCGSGDVLVQAVAEQKKRGCLMTLVYIVLLFVPVIGWIALFPNSREKITNKNICGLPGVWSPLEGIGGVMT